jgi:hypothetical protein
MKIIRVRHNYHRHTKNVDTKYANDANSLRVSTCLIFFLELPVFVVVVEKYHFKFLCGKDATNIASYDGGGRIADGCWR